MPFPILQTMDPNNSLIREMITYNSFSKCYITRYKAATADESAKYGHMGKFEFNLEHPTGDTPTVVFVEKNTSTYERGEYCDLVGGRASTIIPQVSIKGWIQYPHRNDPKKYFHKLDLCIVTNKSVPTRAPFADLAPPGTEVAMVSGADESRHVTGVPGSKAISDITIASLHCARIVFSENKEDNGKSMIYIRYGFYGSIRWN